MKHVIQFLGYLVTGFILMLGFSYFLDQSAHAASIVCETAFQQKTIVITGDSVAFSQGEYSEQSRTISSVDHVRTEKKNKGFIKILQMNGQKHRVRIKDTEAFSELEDSLKITSPKGHEITYPLTCRSV